ncbi:ribosomal RNA-processing protein 8 [Biomphalaria pfeifferi]|uniref:Ribosomal RNA-processing protein 8 n=1 Tax=Biomphalaria pfeifferi TaxID=112525 RepID=A0AAD8BEB5_BIOPF|nr:ribosomal RNA-processing protein 8 [Biomphalaria pfeifferi]
MSGFELNTKWDVDKTAETLNNSLFGKSRAKGKKNKSKTNLSKSRSFQTNQGADSDDEQLSKKEKKKLKERRRKLKKTQALSGHIQQNLHQNAATKQKMDTGINKNKHKMENKVEASVKSKKKHTIKTNDKPANKNEPDKDLHSVSGQSGEKKKRKRSLSKESDSPFTVPKKFKLDPSVSTASNSAVSASEGPKRKNRKKKNTSKKNREKHLALKNKIKPSLAVINREGKADGYQADTSNTIISDCNVQNNTSGKRSLKNIEKKNKKSTKDFKAVKTLEKEKNELENGTSGNNISNSHKRNKKSLKNSSQNTSIHVSENSFQEEPNYQQKKDKNENLANDDLSDRRKDKKKKKKKSKCLSNQADAESLQANESQRNGKSSKKNSTDSVQKIKSENVKKEHLEQNGFKISADMNSSNSEHSLWGSTSLGSQARDKLKSARFRFINEQLYTCTGAEALKMFHSDKEAFQVYHEGYENQVSKWPVNPVDILIRQIKSKPTNLVIADFGCGDAKLAASLPHKVNSFDLVATNDRITACDMSKTPLPNESVDIAVFCLSLMGTNIGDYILEANRVLKNGGLLKIIEVVSRFKGVSEFIGGIYKRGFQLLHKRDVNEMFYQMDFKKIKTMKKSLPIGPLTLNPCLYKKR